MPYIDFLKILVDYRKEKEIKPLYVNNGKDIHHYSPSGNALLAKAINKRLKTTEAEEIILINDSNGSNQ